MGRKHLDGDEGSLCYLKEEGELSVFICWANGWKHKIIIKFFQQTHVTLQTCSTLTTSQLKKKRFFIVSFFFLASASSHLLDPNSTVLSLCLLFH